jgi:8-oxo-dGTP pyrophosphatase MutT (NUDIX family)
MPRPDSPSPPFRKLGEQRRYTGTLISVGTATFSGPGGDSFERDVVHHPGAVSVVPLRASPGDGRPSVVLVRQYRAAVESDLLEIPAGKRDVAGEPPEATAHRELQEEIGLRAGRLERLAHFYNSPGFSDEHSYVFMATALEPATAAPQGVEERYMTVVEVSMGEVPGLVASGGIVDAKTIIWLCLARHALGLSDRGPDQ